jgi:serine/threonine-protein kinase
MLPGRTSIKVIPVNGGPALTVADSGVGPWGAAWSRDGFIYAASAAPTVTGIVRVPESGGGAAQPATVIDRAAGETSHINPMALPNGKAIIFTVQRGGATASNEIAVAVPGSGTHTRLLRGVAARYAETGHLLYVTSDGTLMGVGFDQDRLRITGDPVPLIQGLPAPGAYGDVELTIAPSGAMWYTTGGGGTNVEPVWVTRNGVATPVQPGWRGDINYPALSPDGSRVAYSTITGDVVQLWTKRLDRGTPVIFARQGAVNFRPSWSPDGRDLAWVSDRGADYDIYFKPADQASEERRLFGVRSTKPVWEVVHAAVGGWILYRVEEQGSDIYGIRPGVDSVPVALVVTAASERTPIVTPDGRWLAYASDQTGRYEVYVRPFPNVNAAVWQVSTDGGSQPRWSRSGRDLFFVNTANDLVSVAVLPGASFAWDEPRKLFSVREYRRPVNGRSYDIAPGDQRFFMLRGVQDSTKSEIIAVENFFAELRAKVPR